jgi:hypothetical protein
VGFLGGFFWVLLGGFFWAGFLLPTLNNGSFSKAQGGQNFYLFS